MPLPMIHLAIAARLGETQTQCMSPAFLLGSLSPDAIHMRPQSTRADKNATHLVLPDNRFAAAADLQALIEQHTTAAPPLPVFALGYVAHILTDNFWMRQVIDPFRNQIPDDLDHAAIRTLYYKDTDPIDFNLYHNATWRPVVWEKLAAAEAPDFPPLLSDSEIDGWRERTLHWFTDPDKEPDNDPVYITDSIAHEFIDTASVYVAEQFDSWGLLFT